ncbi:hypothetical protein B0T16DRAFT_147440 [Cercophora newfieldiana]|uniref:Uncharacterized protein n=1 Tax=Cercophora newfieldiana TaxID=92897 RepID=A0AA40CQT3_9PEZI|nr:hypothetical protein B0T16DRAFT_147440 [Cercophora newfieldiana]
MDPKNPKAPQSTYSMAPSSTLFPISPPPSVQYHPSDTSLPHLDPHLEPYDALVAWLTQPRSEDPWAPFPPFRSDTPPKKRCSKAPASAGGKKNKRTSGGSGAGCDPAKGHTGK